MPFGVNLFAPSITPVDPVAYRGYRHKLRAEADRLGLDGALPDIQEDDDGWAEKVELLVAEPVPVVSFTFGLPDHATRSTISGGRQRHAANGDKCDRSPRSQRARSRRARSARALRGRPLGRHRRGAPTRGGAATGTRPSGSRSGGPADHRFRRHQFGRRRPRSAARRGRRCRCRNGRAALPGERGVEATQRRAGRSTVRRHGADPRVYRTSCAGAHQ